MATMLDEHGSEVRHTPIHHMPLPARLRPWEPVVSELVYRLPDPGTGEVRPFWRATRLASILDDEYLLERWRRRQVLRGLSTSIPLAADLDQAMSESEDESALRSRLNGIAAEAERIAGSHWYAEFGTMVHEWAAAVDARLVTVEQVPEIARAHVIIYLELCVSEGLEPIVIYIERTVVNTALRVAGTLDRIFRHRPTGRMYLGDLKTSRSLQYSRLYFAAQLAEYASADHMRSLDGTRWEPMPQFDPNTAILLHIPSDDPGAARAMPVSLDYGIRAAVIAAEVRELRAEANKAALTDRPYPLPDDPESRLARVSLGIRTSPSAAHLAQLWEENRDLWRQDLTDLGRARLAEIEHSRTRARHALSLDESDRP